MNTALLALVLFLTAAAAVAAVPEASTVLVFESRSTYQVMEGLEATVPWTPIWTKTKPEPPPKGFIADRHRDVKGRDEPVPPALMAQVLDAAVFELGLTRLRLEVGPYMEKGNDNDQPDVTDPQRFCFSWLDCCVEEIVLPIKERIERRGDRLVLTVSYAIENWETPHWLQQPAEYEEFARTVLTHLRDKYALVPDYWVLGNESKMGHSAMVSLGKWIKKEGLPTRFAFPEAVNLKKCLRYVEDLKANYPEGADYIGQVTYHTYGAGGNAERNWLRDWAGELGVTTAMTEKIGAGPDQLFWDLTEANAAAWQRYGLMWFGDSSAKSSYFTIKPDCSGFIRSVQYWQLRQYFHHIRPGSVRVGMSSTHPSLRPVGFLSRGGKPVVVILNAGDESGALIQGLPVGRYAVSYSAREGRPVEGPPLEVSADRPAALQVPERCVLTLTADTPSLPQPSE